MGKYYYIVSDYGFGKHFDFFAENILAWPDQIASKYLSFAKPLAGMEIKPAPATGKAYDNRYPAEIGPSLRYSDEKVKTPEDAIFAVRELIQDSDREIIGVINLNGWKPLNFQLVAVGNGNNVFVSSGLLLRSTLLSNANSIILFHNHPSGTLEPSEPDILMTEKVRCLCSKCGITMMDHVIIPFNNDFCFSFYKDAIFDAESKESPFKSIAECIRRTFLENSERDSALCLERENPDNLAAENSAATNKRLRRR